MPSTRVQKSARLKPNYWLIASGVASLLSLLLGFLVFWPSALGLLGKIARVPLLHFLGWSSFASPFFLAWFAKKTWEFRDEKFNAVTFLKDALLVPAWGFLSLLFTFSYVSNGQADIAGRWGLATLEPFLRSVGVAGAGLFILVFGGLWLKAAFGVVWTPVLKKFGTMIYEDWKAWRKTLKEKGLSKKEGEPRKELLPVKDVLDSLRLTNTQANDGLGPKTRENTALLQKSSIKKNGNFESVKQGAWLIPSLELLLPPNAASRESDNLEYARSRANDLVRALASFDVLVELADVVPGPVVTRYDVAPQPGVKVGEIAALANDVALALKVASVRILGPIAGKGVIGIEVPNAYTQIVRLRDVLETPIFYNSSSDLVFALGRSASGEPVACDLTEMPHLLVAGATNSGKSVMIHAMIVSFLYRFTPDELKLVLIDPKRLELPFYNGIPHLFDPRRRASEVEVITDAKESSRTLTALVDLMEYRYEKFSAKNVRNIASYNETATKAREPLEPYVVVVIDELADLMLIAGREVETTIQRLAQMARAVGIHLVLATQRPSVDVLTGTIKANLPARIAMQVVSRVDSRVILDTQGAETLLGAGDMLYLASGAQRPTRLQGAYVTDDEISKVVKFWSDQGGPAYAEPEELLGKLKDDPAGSSSEERHNLAKALTLVLERRRVSQDLLKAHFGSSAKATDLLSRLEVGGFIFKPEGTNRWEIRYDKIEEYLNSLGKKSEN